MNRRQALGVAFLAAACLAAAPKPEARIVYQCHRFIASGEAGGAALNLDMDFGEDGTVLRRRLLLEDYGGSVVAGGSTAQATAAMRWPGEHRTGPGEATLEWPEGSIKIAAFPKDFAAARPRKGETWSQSIVDRDGAVTVFDSGGDRFAFLPGFDLYLADTLRPATYASMLTVSLNSLLTWGRDRSRLTVYHTLIKGRSFRRRNSASPLSARRIAHVFEIDLDRVRALTRLARTRFEAWESGIGDFRKQCRRIEETEGDIVVTRSSSYSAPAVSYFSITQGSSWAASTHSRSQGWESIPSI
jgi:hypothetical protein